MSRAGIAAYTAAALFVANIAGFLVLPPEGRGNVGIAVLAIAAHIAILPVVAALDAPSWARACGYGWLIVDFVTDIAALYGSPPEVYLAIRFGGHIPAGLWMTIAAWRVGGLARIVGGVAGIWLAGYSFVAPFVPTTFYFPVIFPILGWLVLAGRRLRDSAARLV